MWYFVVFQPSKCNKAHFQPQISSIWPIFPNDLESLPKFCYIKRKNSEILSRLGALLSKSNLRQTFVVGKTLKEVRNGVKPNFPARSSCSNQPELQGQHQADWWGIHWAHRTPDEVPSSSQVKSLGFQQMWIQNEPSISRNLVVKAMGGKEVKAKEIVQYYKSYMEIFKGNTMPEPKSILEVVFP